MTRVCPKFFVMYKVNKRCHEEYINMDVKQHNIASMHVTGLLNYEASKHGKCAKSLLGAGQNTKTPVQPVSCCKGFLP